METMKKVLLAGSVCADVSLYLDHLPSHEEDVNVKKMEMRMGGCVWHIGDVLAHEDVPFDLIAPVGTGMYGDFVRAHMQAEGLPVYDRQEENGACFCLIDGNGDRSFLSVHGAEYHFSSDMFARLDLDQYGMAYVSGIDLEEDQGALYQLLKKLDVCSVPLVFAPGPRITHLPAEKIRKILAMRPLLHLNRKEAEELENFLHGAGDPLSFLHACTQNTVIMSDGPRPVHYCDAAGNRGSVTCAKVRQTNGTGAGDHHIGMIMACLMKKMGLMEAIARANQTSAAWISR